MTASIFAETYGPSAFHMRARTEGLRDFGACMSPQNAFYILQGVETLPVRMARHVANTHTVVQFLATHDAVAWVLHPSLASHADYRLAKRVLPKGAGSIVSFGVKGGRAAGRRFIEALRARLASRQRRRRQDAGDPSGLDHASAGRRRGARGGRRRRGHDPALGRPRGSGRHHRGPRSRAAPLAEGLRATRWRSSSTAHGLPRRLRQGVRCRRCRPSCSSTAPAWTTRSGPCRRAISPIAAATRSRSDLPGHGRSGGGRSPRSRRWPTGCGSCSRRSSVDAATLVGHSMGALIGLERAARHRRGSPALALLGAAPRDAGPSGAARGRGRPEPLAAELICDWGFGPAGHFGGHKAPGSWMMGHGMRLLDPRRPDRVLHTDLAACDAYEGGLAAAAKLRCPTLVLAGEFDRMTPARQAREAGRGDQGRPLRRPAGLRPHDDGRAARRDARRSGRVRSPHRDLRGARDRRRRRADLLASTRSCTTHGGWSRSGLRAKPGGNEECSARPR